MEPYVLYCKVHGVGSQHRVSQYNSGDVMHKLHMYKRKFKCQNMCFGDCKNTVCTLKVYNISPGIVWVRYVCLYVLNYMIQFEHSEHE